MTRPRVVAPLKPLSLELDVPPLLQPDDVSCGPTCLRMITGFYGKDVSEQDILAHIPPYADGGTFAACLGVAALRLGYKATLYPFAVMVFDPTWSRLSQEHLRDRLRRRTAALPPGKLRDVHYFYEQFLDLGGSILLRDLTPHLVVSLLDQVGPLVCGVSSTWLYQAVREIPETMKDDDILGMPTGHFVVVSGYEKRGRRFIVHDPWEESPLQTDLRSVVSSRRLLHAVLLGDVTYDAVILAIHPPEPKGEP